MADFTIYAGNIAYAKGMHLSLAQNAKCSIMNDPNNQVLTINGKETVYRQADTNGASDYVDSWPNGYGNAEVKQATYYAPYDRGFSASIDSVKEAQSFIEGAKPSLVGVAQEFIKKHLAPEIDTVIFSRMANQAGNKIVNSTPGYGITKSAIIETLTNIAKDISNNGWDGDIYTFISATVNAAFEQALLEKNILMNDVVIKRQMTREEIADGFEPLTVEFRVRKFNNMIIVPVPDDRMAGKVLMLNGISVGQTDGGVLPQKNNPGYYDINILAIPADCAYANIRHIVSQMFVPANVPLEDYAENINLVNEKLFGTLTLENVGVNPFGDGFKFNTRTLYGGDIFDKYKDSCILVKSADGTQTIAPKKASFVGAESDLTGANAATDTPKFIIEPANASGTVYFASTTTASATVEASKSISVGDDGIPYVAPTVTYGSTAGTSKISAYSDSNKTVKIGEITVTSTGA